MSGELQVKLETDIVTATTYFKDLPNHKFGELNDVFEWKYFQ